SRPSSPRPTGSPRRWAWSPTPPAGRSSPSADRRVLGRWLSPVRVRPLREEDRAAALELCAADPVANVLAAVQTELLGRRRLPGADVLGVWREGRLEALCWAGAN